MQTRRRIHPEAAQDNTDIARPNLRRQTVQSRFHTCRSFISDCGGAADQNQLNFKEEKNNDS
jgi:hypothetical protein